MRRALFVAVLLVCAGVALALGGDRALNDLHAFLSHASEEPEQNRLVDATWRDCKWEQARFPTLAADVEEFYWYPTVLAFSVRWYLDGGKRPDLLALQEALLDPPGKNL